MTQPPQDPQRNVDPEPLGTPAEQPSFDQPTFDQPAADQQPADAQPYAAPFRAEPAAAAAPAHAQPEAPVYGQPEAPAYGQPTGTPAYGQTPGQFQGQQQYAGAPYQGQQYGPPVNQKSKIVAGILGILLGGLGIHNFYLGFTKKALIQLLITVLSVGFLSWVSAIWGLIEGVLILISKPGEQWHRDAAGVELTD
ncbi:NINE protein [Tessaracoccus sp. MC1679]|uniref:TM2 domain-containing protein n=1 Tax=Tessaracoccus sp. MC1679 TaxID=2760313 RepID=UPI001601F857|nr:NINE protein [Tessaracoccus sp. MC1679]MBB1517263.1 NINE protein [Tessaracoccus sp. MC1679]